MMRLGVCVLLVLCANTAAAEQLGYALIVTNNRSQSSERPDLHYADDDGVQYAALFAELVGPERVQLLTQLDAETAALHPGVQASPPTRGNLERAVEHLTQQLAQARAAGHRSIVYLAFAGHGDIDRGQGYLDLADGRLTARALDEQLIARLDADRVHLFLDSCNAYFLLTPRKPGGKRWQSDQTPARDLLAKYPKLGVVVSTSAEAITYEWSELQSGIFSYEVRAGLRGAADVDGDHRITYAELTAFIRVANRPLTNDLYRPKVFARSPQADPLGAAAVLVEWPANARRELHLDGGEHRRLTLRDGRGVRILDVHKEAGTELQLHLPAGTAITASERIGGPERPAWIDRELPEGQEHLAGLSARPAAHSGRGEPPLFSLLFAEPFGRRAFAREQRAATVYEDPPSDVSTRDVERLRLYLSYVSSTAKEARFTTAASLILIGTIPTAALSFSLYKNSDHSSGWVDRTGFSGGVAFSAYTLCLGVYFLIAPWSEESLHESFIKNDYTTERARAQGVPIVERAFRERARSSRTGRKVAAWASILGGAVNILVGSVIVTEDLVRSDSMRMLGPLDIAIGLGQLLFGVYLHNTSSTLEELWQTYSHDPAVLQRRPP